MRTSTGNRRNWILAVAVATVIAVAMGSPGLVREPARALPFIGIFLCAELLVAWQVVSGLRLNEKLRQLMAASPAEASRLGLRTARRGALLAGAFTLIVVGNCSALANQGPGGLGAVEAAADPAGFLLAALMVLAPIMIALALPVALATIAQRLAEEGRGGSASRLAQIAVVTAVTPFVVALASAFASVAGAYATCIEHPASGACVATSGGVAVVFAALAPLLILPGLIGMVKPLQLVPERDSGQAFAQATRV